MKWVVYVLCIVPSGSALAASGSLGPRRSVCAVCGFSPLEGSPSRAALRSRPRCHQGETIRNGVRDVSRSLVRGVGIPFGSRGAGSDGGLLLATQAGLSDRLKGRVVLVLHGVDSAFHVWLNGFAVGFAKGSRLPCEFDVTDALKARRIQVRPAWGPGDSRAPSGAVLRLDTRRASTLAPTGDWVARGIRLVVVGYLPAEPGS